MHAGDCMWDALYKKMSSLSNLELAWARLKTAQNLYYKNYYRNLFLAYELNAKDNLRQLSKRLMGGSYDPSSILRFYIPKNSGLHRPITFLHLDDQIVYQAIANIIAEKLWQQRLEVQGVTTFSNLFNLSGKRSIFFFHSWQDGYRRYLKRIKELYSQGNTWVAHFDLAAYYDTIDLQLLAKQVSAKSYDNFTNFIVETISKWTTHKSTKLHHGIPQGPSASSLIGEVYLLPVDKKLQKGGINYVRYVDDIKILGNTKEEVQKGIILLERECKERGLIPHAKKYEIAKAANIDDAIGKFPSLQSEEKKIIFKDEKEAFSLFAKAFDPAAFDVSRVRYILKTSGKNERILSLVLTHIREHPELVDDFCTFLRNYRDSELAAVLIYNKTIAQPIVYSYVEGQYWNLLAEFNIKNGNRKKKYLQEAMFRLSKSRDEYSLKLGLYKFICLSHDSMILKWLPYESSCLIQMSIFPYISPSLYDDPQFERLLKVLINRSNYDAPLVAIKEIIFNEKEHLIDFIGHSYKDDTGVIANTLGHVHDTDPIEKILSKHYVMKFNKWKQFLGTYYKQANQLCYLASKAYYIDRNAWLNYTDAFADIVLRALITLLKSKKITGLPDIIDAKTGKLVDYGTLLNDKVLKGSYQSITGGFHKVHQRRSKAPSSHAFDKKTHLKTKPVRMTEQKNLTALLNGSLNNLLTEVGKYI
jgi:hypothetical protein